MDAGVEDVPARALDLHQLELTDVATLDALDYLARVGRYQEAVGHGCGQAAQPDGVQKRGAVRRRGSQGLLHQDTGQGEVKAGAGYLEVGRRPGEDADHVRGAGPE